ncbi:PD40 domain-containing protein [Moraxella canis]|uniref:Translocation protein TolB n=1 Tax=Moraxella canis TaxID=90239 RepID=A0A1S9ZJ39_9GAMM|nr:PD40 domain-containing protein [Moraxella canis]OOR83287.1 translocation protein TolB [Moraxella canis]
MKSPITKACLALTISLAAADAHADDELIVITEQVAQSRYPVAVMPFSDAHQVSHHLSLAGLGATHQNLPQHTQASSEILRNLTTWRNQGFEYVILAQSHSIPGNKLAISYEIVDTKTGSVSVKHTQISDNHPAAVQAAYRQISDKIYQAITGQPSDLMGKIAYVEESGSPHNKVSTLKLIDPSGQLIRTLDTVNGSIMTPAFSPDGLSIAYSVQTKNSLPVIYIVPVSGGTPKLVTPFWGHNLAPSFSPDGGSILFSGSHENNNPNIYRLNLHANHLDTLTTLAGAENSPNYLADGSGFIYTADKGTRRQSLYRYEFGNARSTQIASHATNPRLSLDTSKLVYVSGGRIIIANAQGRAQQSFGVLGTDVSASFSPSGTRIIYTSNQGSKNQLMIRSLSSNATRAIPTSGAARDPIWSK